MLVCIRLAVVGLYNKKQICCPLRHLVHRKEKDMQVYIL